MTNPNDPAFPCDGIDTGKDVVRGSGLTKREEFAKALAQGFAANPVCTTMTSDDFVELIVARADDLIAELSK